MRPEHFVCEIHTVTHIICGEGVSIVLVCQEFPRIATQLFYMVCVPVFCVAHLEMLLGLNSCVVCSYVDTKNE